MKLNDVDVQMEADSGADVNIMDEHQFRAFVHRSSDKPILQPSNVKLYTLQHKLDVRGEFRATIGNDTCGKLETFVVVFGRIKSPPLIGKETLIGLAILKIQPNGSLAKPNSLGISSVVVQLIPLRPLECRKWKTLPQSTVTCLRALERWKIRNVERRSQGVSI